MFGFLRKQKERQPDPPAGVTVIARLAAHLGPAERRTTYEVPMAAALGTDGDIVGGGSMANERGEALFIEIEVRLREVTERMLDRLVHTLEQAGAPKGSSLWASDGTELRRFGRMEVVALDILAHGLPEEVYRRFHVQDLVDEIAPLMGAAGRYQGLRMLPDRGVLYFHGRDAAAMERAIREVAAFHPLCRNAAIRRPPRA
ncbi:hypothetical protein SAMN05444722_1091 [Rhodovulum sp. ES.010]|uniref:hypothetical protein n=1 Tax=Rhodovulum sp. ES.010 TaxID=1882821 RepID=UPI00092A9021|nr:hypothetical protein [Rhodovulum sp. ES.010]SIO26492.1 hypothetical protein SAMN05444722_1091 [Rhodovulum sp. ES.010]